MTQDPRLLKEAFRKALVKPPVPIPPLRGRWAVVTQVAPLRVQMIGDNAEIDATPETLTNDLVVGDRVWTSLTDRGALIVIGRAGPDRPLYTILGSGVDLNSLVTPGGYHQGNNAAAASGTNYPEPYAGLLEVNTVGVFTYQRYSVYRGGGDSVTGAGKVWGRSYYNGVWGAWFRMDSIPGTWQNLPLVSGFGHQSGGTCRYRLGAGGAYVEFQWGVSNAGMSAGNTFRIVDTGGLPESCRPGITKYFPISGSTANNAGVGIVYASGAVDVRCGSTLSTYYILDAIRYAPGS